LRLGRYLGTSPEFWMNKAARAEVGKEIERTVSAA
jgi:plasmid maintenance system antidote protein VapI